MNKLNFAQLDANTVNKAAKDSWNADYIHAIVEQDGQQYLLEELIYDENDELSGHVAYGPFSSPISPAIFAGIYGLCECEVDNCSYSFFKSNSTILMDKYNIKEHTHEYYEVDMSDLADILKSATEIDINSHGDIINLCLDLGILTEEDLKEQLADEYKAIMGAENLHAKWFI